MNASKTMRNLVLYGLLFLVVASFINLFALQRHEPNEVSYDTFYSWVEKGKVQSVVISEDKKVTGQLKDGTRFSTVKPAISQDLDQLMIRKGVQVKYEAPVETPWWTALLSTLLPVILVIGAFAFIMQQSQSGGNRVMQFGRSRARLHSDDPKRRVTFADVAGVDEAKEELMEIVDFLKNPKRYQQLGARIPKGVLLYGSPGTGKTLLARAVAGEAGVPFFSISGSDFVEMFVGVGASRVRDLFETAKKNAPCIVFIDEIDAVGRQRGAGYGGGHDEREQTLNQLLVEMDGFSANEGIIVMAATNRPDVLDPALLRPGRFDRQIVIDKPDLKGREAILKVHARNKPLAEDVDLSVIARRTPGFTGADLENVLNEAALLAARRRKKAISMSEIEDAIDRIVAGGPEKKSRLISEKEKERVAYHEAGHALVSSVLPGADPVHKISIIPRGTALGYTLQLPAEDRYLVTRSEIMDRICVLLSGRAAEEIVFGEITTGAQDDLERSTKMARRMITEFGMSEELGPMTFGHRADTPFLGRDLVRDRNYSEEVAARIDKEVNHLVTTLYQKTLDILRSKRDQLDKIARRLMERETLEGPELAELLANPA